MEDDQVVHVLPCGLSAKPIANGRPTEGSDTLSNDATDIVSVLGKLPPTLESHESDLDDGVYEDPVGLDDVCAISEETGFLPGSPGASPNAEVDRQARSDTARFLRPASAARNRPSSAHQLSVQRNVVSLATWTPSKGTVPDVEGGCRSSPSASSIATNHSRALPELDAHVPHCGAASGGKAGGAGAIADGSLGKEPISTSSGEFPAATLHQFRELLDSSFARQETTIEKLFAFHLKQHKPKDTFHAPHAAPSPVFGSSGSSINKPEGSRLQEEPKSRSVPCLGHPSRPRGTLAAFHGPAERRNIEEELAQLRAQLGVPPLQQQASSQHQALGSSNVGGDDESVTSAETSPADKRASLAHRIEPMLSIPPDIFAPKRATVVLPPSKDQEGADAALAFEIPKRQTLLAKTWQSVTTKSNRSRISTAEAEMRANTLALSMYDTPVVPEEDPAQKDRFHNFVKSTRFEAVAACLLVSNIAVIGVQVEYKARMETQAVPLFFRIINALYCMLFLLELVVRLRAWGWYPFFFEGDFLWSWFDLVVVLMQLMETTVSVIDTGGDGKALRHVAFVGRLVRAARILRIFRIIRVMRFVRPFKVLITAIYGTVKSCAWTILLLVIIMYVFGMIFAQSVADFLLERSAHEDEYDDLKFYYGSLPRSIFTLYKGIIGGVDWEDIITPLSHVSWVNTVLFLCYVSFIHMVVMNVVAGLFLQSAIEQAQQDQDHVVFLRLAEKQVFVDKLESLFTKLDTSGDGSISLQEFEAHLKDEHMQAFLASFGIETFDAWTLFKLLDTDGGGSVDYSEFVEGCIRLKGNAKSIQMAQLMYHHKWIMDKICELQEMVMEALLKCSPQSAQVPQQRAFQSSMLS